jgi:hypothetical protein
MKLGIAVLALSLAATLPLLAQELQETRCGKVLARQGSSNAHFALDKDLHVLAQTSGGDFNPGPAPDGATVRSIFCYRSDIVPAVGDYKVVSAGYPLMIYSQDEQRLRIAVLEMANGRLQYRGVGTTKFDGALRARIQAVLDASVPKFAPRPVLR